MQIKEHHLAVTIFEQIMEMREEEPQSYRDLALALAAVNQHQRAVDLLYKVVKGDWHGRFPDIQMIALNEMNAIISTCRKQLYLKNIDKRLIRNLPVDVRVVLSWDADNMELYVNNLQLQTPTHSHGWQNVQGLHRRLWTGRVLSAKSYFRQIPSPCKLLRQSPAKPGWNHDHSSQHDHQFW